MSDVKAARKLLRKYIVKRALSSPAEEPSADSGSPASSKSSDGDYRSSPASYEKHTDDRARRYAIKDKASENCTDSDSSSTTFSDSADDSCGSCCGCTCRPASWSSETDHCCNSSHDTSCSLCDEMCDCRLSSSDDSDETSTTHETSGTDVTSTSCCSDESREY